MSWGWVHYTRQSPGESTVKFAVNKAPIDQCHLLLKIEWFTGNFLLGST
jgi:hypothetical protein